MVDGVGLLNSSTCGEGTAKLVMPRVKESWEGSDGGSDEGTPTGGLSAT